MLIKYSYKLPFTTWAYTSNCPFDICKYRAHVTHFGKRKLNSKSNKSLGMSLTVECHTGHLTWWIEISFWIVWYHNYECCIVTSLLIDLIVFRCDVYVHVCPHTHKHINIHLYMYIYIHIYLQTYKYTCTYTCIDTYKHINIHLYMYIHIYTHTLQRTYIYVHVHAYHTC